ncbi:MAG: hypothetical protein J0M03_10165 [Acidobacteria bacterium]|nr:hypothetical protein [Acidobacteriota bacterium]
MQNKNSDDLDFNIEEVEQVIAPQIDTGGGDIGIDDGDTGIDDGEDSAKSGGGGRVTRTGKFCC